MAKTKRRQLAALAAQAELKELAGHNDRTSSYNKVGPSGTIPPIADPMVEIRTQRVVIKIPALPSKPAADTSQSPEIAKKAVLGKRRRKPQMDIDFSSEQVPADEAKISKVISQFGKWKRRKRMRDLPSGEKITAPTGLSNGDQQSPVTKSLVSDKHSNGDLHLSIAKPERQSKSRVNLLTGSRKRVKLQEVLVRSPAEKESKSLEAQGRRKETTECTMDGAASRLATLDQRSGDLVRDTNRSQESAKACNGDIPSTLAHSTVSQKRGRRNIRKVIPQVPGSPKAAAVLHHKTRARVKISDSEAIAIEGFQEIQYEKNITRQRKNFGRGAKDDTLLVRSAADGGAVNTTQDQSQAVPQKAQILTSPVIQETEELTHVRLTVDSSSNDLVQNGRHTPHQTSLQGDGPDDLKSQLQIPISPVSKNEIDLGQSTHCSGGKHTVLRGAELMKEDNQLAILQKRLQAAGGLRKWLLDKGLGQFAPILEERNIDNLSLLQLTMEGLKSMGLVPVGPRRKLIHAISSLTLPSFAKASFVNSRHRR